KRVGFTPSRVRISYPPPAWVSGTSLEPFFIPKTPILQSFQGVPLFFLLFRLIPFEDVNGDRLGGE
ncbi:MAG: hypothetical protein M3036_06890, partial [Bifidobacteriales bacterium]|nr:hypothetical protein [Bifidobacteriales bacterium]